MDRKLAHFPVQDTVQHVPYSSGTKSYLNLSITGSRHDFDSCLSKTSMTPRPLSGPGLTGNTTFRKEVSVFPPTVTPLPIASEWIVVGGVTKPTVAYVTDASLGWVRRSYLSRNLDAKFPLADMDEAGRTRL